MTEKVRFTIVALVSASAGVGITLLITHFSYRQNLEFLGLAHQFVEQGLQQLNEALEDE